MSIETPTAADATASARRERNRARLADVHRRARRLFDGGATGIQVAADLSTGMDGFIVDLLTDALQTVDEATRQRLQQHTAIVAVGGTGRGDPAPFSDVDLLFLYQGTAKNEFEFVTSQVVRDFWDARVKLGHAIRTIGETISLAKEETDVATALVEARLLWGSSELFEELQRKFAKSVVQRRRKAFISSCISARETERKVFGGSATQLEPDVKCSAGGLRDLHLIRWIGFAKFDAADIDTQKLRGALNRDDARRLLAAQEYLMRIRCEMHFNGEHAQDVLTREEQLRIAEKRDIQAPLGQRPVERLMQTYFQHSTAIAQICRRFAAKHQPRSWGRRLFGSLLSHRVNGTLRVGSHEIDVAPRHLDAVSRRLEEILELYRAAAWYGLSLSARVVEAVAHSQPELDGFVSERSAALFLDILKRPGMIGSVLRNMHESAVLELVIPNMAHARCLLQFNQYHHYTVDEHTFRAIEAAEAFQLNEGPLGTAYRAIRHKEILHLALLLHDLGKGFEEDHSDVGRVIAETIAPRLCLPDHHRETLAFLVHKHLRMTHLAFRRDCSDPDMLMDFSREVGSPETLRMLYVLSASDLTGVGKGVFTDWKADLLTDLYDHTMQILSGKPFRHHEEQRMAAIKKKAAECFEERESDPSLSEWAGRQLDSFTPQYLTATTPERIAADLQIIRNLSSEEVVVEGLYDEATHTVDYRILVDAAFADGCFHRMCGALAAKRLEILAANICTTAGGIVVDSFRVNDRDYDGPVPRERVVEVAESLRVALSRTATVKTLFRKYQRFGEGRVVDPLTDQKLRVAIDNDSSEQCTVIDVFAQDRRGLLYTVTRAIYKLDLSVQLAKISTHLDQVVDVFYVTDQQGRKIRDGERLKDIRSSLTDALAEFERDGHREFLTA